MKKNFFLKPSFFFTSAPFAALTLSFLVLLLFANNLNKPSVAQTAPGIKVAFLGDDGDGSNYQANLRMIKSEGAAFVVDGGDLDYKNNPSLWDGQVTSILGAGYPYLVSMGNHDKAQWSGYSQKINSRIGKVAGLSCSGNTGIQQTCTYKGILIVITAPGYSGSGHEAYIKSKLTSSTAKWKICSWHANMKKTQVGGKGDATGWGVYEECRKGGAIIANAHEHSYHRTKTLSSINGSLVVDTVCPNGNALCVALGKTFLFVSGLGGNSVRQQVLCQSGCPEWAEIYTSNQGAKPGTLFITFNYNGDPNKAHGYFKNINGQIVDEFDITTTGSSVPTPTSPQPTPTGGSAPTPTNTPPTVAVPTAAPPSGLTPTYACLGSCPTDTLPNPNPTDPDSNPTEDPSQTGAPEPTVDQNDLNLTPEPTQPSGSDTNPNPNPNNPVPQHQGLLAQLLVFLFILLQFFLGMFR